MVPKGQKNPKWDQNGTKNGPEMDQKWIKNGPIMDQDQEWTNNGPKYGTKSNLKEPKMTKKGLKDTKIGPKWDQKVPNGSKGTRRDQMGPNVSKQIRRATLRLVFSN